MAKRKINTKGQSMTSYKNATLQTEDELGRGGRPCYTSGICRVTHVANPMIIHE